MRQPRLPDIKTSRIVVDSLETKKQLIEIGEKTGETLKEIVVRLVGNEYKGVE